APAQRLHQALVLDEGEEEGQARPDALAQDAGAPVPEEAGGIEEVELKVAPHVEEAVVLDHGVLAEAERPRRPRDGPPVDERGRPAHAEVLLLRPAEFDAPVVREAAGAREDRAARPVEHAARGNEAGRAYGEGT